MNIFEFKKNTTASLKSPSPQLDTEVLLEHFTGFNRTRQLLNRDWEIPEDTLSKLNEAVAKRNTGLPVAYITGKKEFYGYSFYVTPDVLIPKPDTEILVEKAIDSIIEKMENRPDRLLTICDMCTGSGCIAAAVMKTLIDVYKIPAGNLPSFTLADISEKALEIARKNMDALILNNPENSRIKDILQSRVHFVRTNLFEQFSFTGGWTFDLILTNPPYIPHSMVNELLKDGRSEPRLALDGDINLMGLPAISPEGEDYDDGLEIIRNLLPQSVKHLSPLGKIIMETGEYNAEEAAAIAESYGYKTELYEDLEGQLRGFTGQLTK